MSVTEAATGEPEAGKPGGGNDRAGGSPSGGPAAEPARPRLLARRRMTPNMFGIAFGLAGLGEVWQASVPAVGVSQVVPNVIYLFTAAAWFGLLVLYLSQGPRQILADLRDPVLAPFPSLGLIVGMLLSAALGRYAPTAGQVLVSVFLALTILLGGWLTGQWIAGAVEPERLHPGYFLPTVAGGLIGAATASQVGLHGLGELSFGIGMLCWVLLGSIILNRLFFTAMLPAPLVPTLAIELAPPAVAGLAYFDLTDGRTDAFAAALGGYAILMTLVQLRFAPLYRKLTFGPGFWSFTFSYAAALTDAIVWMQLRHTPGAKAWSIVILVLATALIGAIAARTVPLLLKGSLLPAKQPAVALNAR
ncbi:MAG: TDT family transporter [Actinocrinis sp.]